MLKVKRILSGALKENCYVVYDSKSLQAAIIDPGEDGKKVISKIKAAKLKPEILINTHGHYDHIFSDDQIRSEFKIPLAIHKDEVEMLNDPYKNGSGIFSLSKTIKTPEILLKNNQKIELSFATFTAIYTPGHTKGGICLLFKNLLFTGDTLFAGTVGRTDFIDGNYKQLMNSLSKIKKLNPSLIVYPGHGGCTTLAYELKHNPYLKNSSCVNLYASDKTAFV
jgi:glyoxylase-like metal-dependent hydrolase (beta-lactamase superfamily II)